MGPLARYQASDVPLGLEGLEGMEGMEDAADLAYAGAASGAGGGASGNRNGGGSSGGLLGPGEREEWMLTPGEQRATLTEAFGENRKFNQGVYY